MNGKILFVGGHEWDAARGVLVGQALGLTRLIECAVHSGHVVGVVVGARGTLPTQQPTAMGAQVYVVPAIGDMHSFYPFTDTALEDRLGEVIERFSPDVIHCYAPEFFRGSLVNVLLKWRGRVVFTASDFITICPRYNLMTGDDKACEQIWQSEHNCVACHRLDKSLARASFKTVLGCVPAALVGAGLKSRMPRLANLSRSVWRMGPAVREQWSYWPKLIGRVDHLLAPSKQSIDILKLHGWGGKPSTVIPWSLPDGVSAVPEKEAVAFTIGFSGRVVPEKGLLPFLHSLVHLQLPPGSRLILFLDQASLTKSDYGRQCLHAIQSSPVFIEFMRYDGLSGESISEATALLDLLVVPSLWPENLPLVALEAFACGVPVLHGKHAAVSEHIIDKDYALEIDLLNSDPIAAIADAINANHGRIMKLRKLGKSVYGQTVASESAMLNEVYFPSNSQ